MVSGKITDINQNGLTIFVPYTNIERACLREYDVVQVGLKDGRFISPEQKKKAHALIGEIADWAGDLPSYIKHHMKFEFLATRLDDMNRKMFSLANCEKSLATDFISFLIDFMLEFQVPAKVPLYELCEDINRYVYACLMRKACVVCGRKADLHHFDQIGMGRDRNEVYQIGMRVIPLCREHHTVAHTKGRSWLTNDMHLVPIPLTVEIGKKYKLSKKNLGS